MDLLNNNLYKRKNTLINEKSYSQEEFIQKINNISYRYHINHPFDKYLMEGKATKELMQSWVCNRYYYQATIPQKDSAILSNCNDRNVRQKWI
jgi:pyrroloquinoline-quinone synthase